MTNIYQKSSLLSITDVTSGLCLEISLFFFKVKQFSYSEKYLTQNKPCSKVTTANNIAFEGMIIKQCRFLIKFKLKLLLTTLTTTTIPPYANIATLTTIK